MAAATATLTGDLSALVVGAEFNPDHIRARITTNLPPGVPVVDTTTGGALHFGPWELDLGTDGKFSQAGLLRTDTADTNPTGFQYYVEVTYYDATRGAARNPLTWRSTPFSLTTATADLRALLGEAYAPPQWYPVSQDQLNAVANAAVPKALIDAKGDLIVGTANDTVGRIAAPANGSRLVADSAQATGWRATGVREYEGTGSPQGVVAAPVGSVYVDTAATNGALVWRKWTGTGSTGWQVEQGDTGDRLVMPAGTIADMPNLTAAIRRRNSDVTLAVWEATAGGTATGSKTLTGIIPTGFRMRRMGSFAAIGGTPVVDSSGALVSDCVLTTVSNGANATLRNVSSGVRHYAVLTYQTADAWPATLPGTPA